jgi:acetate kinase
VGQIKQAVLTINAGSSSIKFALYEAGTGQRQKLHGKIDRIGLSGTALTFIDRTRDQHGNDTIVAADHHAAAIFLFDWLERQIDIAHVSAVGHRVVHGMDRTGPEVISPASLDELRRISSYAPDHLPCAIDLIEMFRQRFPSLPQVACFDTAFHRSLPRVAKLLPVPRRFDVAGVQRYGFHGLSYTYLLQELAHVAGTQATQGRVILAHLGNGASLAAVRGGQCVDTSMGFTPCGGLPMGTRSGDLDPGVVAHMMQSESLTAIQFRDMINHQSGLLGISERSADMRDLIAAEATDIPAAEAVELFCYQVKKWIGSYVAILNGLDTLVFAGGIGENAPRVRAGICAGLEFLGIELDDSRNAVNENVISAKTSRVAVRVMHTDEELMIAILVCRVLGLPMFNGEEQGYGYDER